MTVLLQGLVWLGVAGALWALFVSTTEPGRRAQTSLMRKGPRPAMRLRLFRAWLKAQLRLPKILPVMETVNLISSAAAVLVIAAALSTGSIVPGVEVELHRQFLIFSFVAIAGVVTLAKRRLSSAIVLLIALCGAQIEAHAGFYARFPVGKPSACLDDAIGTGCDHADLLGECTKVIALKPGDAPDLPRPCGFVVGDPDNRRYFSVVTFTTLGYGDFQPFPQTRRVASAQALIGMSYMALLIALVASRIPAARPPRG